MSIADRIVVMNNGKVEQIDTPKKVYEEPASLFVAEFVGKTNLFNIMPGKKSLILFGKEVPIPEHWGKALSSSIICAIRPEHVTLKRCKHSESQGLILEKSYLGPIVRYEVPPKNWTRS